MVEPAERMDQAVREAAVAPWPVCASAAPGQCNEDRRRAAMRVTRKSSDAPRSGRRPGSRPNKTDSRAARARGRLLQRELAQHIERRLGALAQRLRGKPHRGIDRAEPVVVAPLHDLEEEAPVERVRIGVEEFARSPERSYRMRQLRASRRSARPTGRASPAARHSRSRECRAAAPCARASPPWWRRCRRSRSRCGARRRRHRSRGTRRRGARARRSR